MFVYDGVVCGSLRAVCLCPCSAACLLACLLPPSSQCINGALVTLSTGVKMCECNPGYKGNQCSESIRGRCYRGSWDVALGFCRCDPLWAGEVGGALFCAAQPEAVQPVRSPVRLYPSPFLPLHWVSCVRAQDCDIYTCMHGRVINTGVDIDGAPMMACECLPDWFGAEYVTCFAVSHPAELWSTHGMCLGLVGRTHPLLQRAHSCDGLG
jgi:hypothetical protein